MQYGFIKTASATPEIRVADCAYNGESILAQMEEAAGKGVHLLALPELCVTGYTCGDLFLQQTLLDGAVKAISKLVQESARFPGLVTVVGAPLIVGGKLYNCGVVIHGGRALGCVPKANLPNYNEFYEKRHFSEPPDENSVFNGLGEPVPFGKKLLFACQNVPDFVFGVEMCEDLWVPAPPSADLALAGATVLVNCSASDQTIGKSEYRRQLVIGQSARLLCAYVYADAGAGESTTDLVFSGHDLIAESGVLLAEAKPFSREVAITEVDVSRLSYERRRMTSFGSGGTVGWRRVEFSLPLSETPLTRTVEPMPFVPVGEETRAERCRSILTIQAEGLRKRMEHSHAKTAVVGISGGLDSCLALLVAVRAMDLIGRPRTDVVAVTMPCFGTTARTRSNAEMLTERLGATLKKIDISKTVLSHFEDIGHNPEDFSVTFENAQARERTQVLMDIANQTGGLVIGTGDLSELALGWATYNGDHMSMYGVNASIPKTLIRFLVDYEASVTTDPALQAVLRDILDTPVSPELLPALEGEIAQKTEDIVGPYELHDFYLYYMVRWGCPPKKIFHLAKAAFAGRYDDKTILFWMQTFYRRFFSQQFKRSCIPDGPKVGSVTLSPRGDWRMPSDAVAALWRDEVEALQKA